MKISSYQNILAPIFITIVIFGIALSGCINISLPSTGTTTNAPSATAIVDSDVIHTDSTHIGTWAKFKIINLDKGYVAIQTSDGHYLGAFDGGNKITDAIRSDAKVINEWEFFKIINLDKGYVAIQTSDGHYLTAVDGGNKITDAIRSDATQIGPYEKFKIINLKGELMNLDGGYVAIQTSDGHYLTAVDGGNHK